MDIKVAVIGPFDLVELILDESVNFPSLKFFQSGYKHENETVRLVNRFKNEVDVFLFAGPIPYEIALVELQDYAQPKTYLQYTGTSLYRVFFQFFRNHQFPNVLPSLRFSIDILNRQKVEERLNEVDIHDARMYVKEYELGQDSSEIVQFHQELWMNEKVDAVFTCVTSVYNQLLELGIPCYRILPTRSSINDCLQKVQLEGKSVQLSDTQLAIVIIHLEDFFEKFGASEYVLQRKKLMVQQILIDYGEEAQALINWTNRDEITFVTTRGIIEKFSHNNTRYPLLDRISSELQLKASIGIGLGRTANEAESKAREALLKARISGGDSCYIAIHDGTVLGPLGEQTVMKYSVRTVDPFKLDLAKRAGMSIVTVNKIISYCQGYGSEKITAFELANGFGITLRSARRIICKLEQGGLAEVIGEEQPVGKGRPRQIYKIKLDQLCMEGERIEGTY